jgi:hypothetical protein
VIVRMGNQPLKLDTPISIQPVPGSGGNEAGVPEMPIVRVRAPGMAGGILSPDGGAFGGGRGAGGGAPKALELRQVGSVPGSGGIGLLVGLPTGGPVRLDVYDVLGRRVRSLAGGDLPAGYTLEAWDGRDNQGRAARRGIYFVSLSTPKGRVTTRLLLID